MGVICWIILMIPLTVLIQAKSLKMKICAGLTLAVLLALGV